MKWWEEKKHIFVREQIRLNQNFENNDFEFHERDDFLWLSGTIYLPSKGGFEIDFPFELKYPSNYPFLPPSIFPKGRERNWVGNHQFNSSAFCLDIREKTWNSSLSSIDIIKSLEKLLLSTLNEIENNKDKLEIYEEKEPTRLDLLLKEIRCIVPLPYFFKNDDTYGKFKYHNTLEVYDNRIIVQPTFDVKEVDHLKTLFSSDYFNIYSFNLFKDETGVWLKSSLDHLQSIVFKEKYTDFKKYLLDTKILTESIYDKLIEENKIEYVLFFNQVNALLLTKINREKDKVEYFGCYNLDLSLLYSRIPTENQKTLKTNKCVTIIGCGSGGSCIAEELVKSGITKLLLIDNDYLTVENIFRHTCELTDVGIKKIYALKGRLLKINPKADIQCIDTEINIITDFVDEKLKQSALIINATARVEEVINEYCWQNEIPSIHAKVYPLGFGGEIIRVIPKVTSCFECLHFHLTNLLGKQPNASNFPSEKIINYNETEEGELLPVNSLSVDAKFISLFSVKMALEILSSDNLEDLKSKPNIILWGNEKRWIFSQSFECLKIVTEKFISASNCIVCFGEKQIEEELGLSRREIEDYKIEIKIKNAPD